MKKLLCISLVVIIAAGAVLLGVGCNKPEPTKPFALREYNIPTDLYDYGLTLQWLDGNGNTTAFNPKKSVVILFEGSTPENYKSSYALDSSVYTYSETEGLVDKTSKDINLNLAYYWQRMGYNVGVFHYENYAIGAPQNIIKKFYNAKSVNYINNQGQACYPSDNEFSLTEVFVYLWLDLLKNTPINDTDAIQNSVEVRFIGNQVGANLAVSVADFLYSAYDNGYVAPYAVPNRVSLTNPYFSNEDIDITVDFRQQKHSSALAYNAARIAELARQGVVFELVESDPAFFSSYATPYSGLIEEENSTKLGETGDSALYKSILSNSASLSLRQSYSNLYSEAYKQLDRAALDWYLYSINGSDDASVDNSNYVGPENTKPMVDDIVNYSSGRMFGVSAWTPTPYVRAVKGAQYRMARKSYNSDTASYDIETSVTMSKFRAEANQISNLTKSLICGYVYVSKNGTKYVNWGGDTRLANVEVLIEIDNKNVQGGKDVFKVKTDYDGFYSFVLEPKYYESTINLSIIPPTAGYTFLPDREIIESYYNKYLVSTVNKNKVNLDQSYMYTDSKLVQILLYNCGLKSI